MAWDQFGHSPGCLVIPKAAGPAECSAVHLQSLGNLLHAHVLGGRALSSQALHRPKIPSEVRKLHYFDPAVLFRACKRSISYITSPSMLISWKSQVLSCCCKRQVDHYSSYEGVETQSCDSGVVLFLAEQRDLY